MGDVQLVRLAQRGLCGLQVGVGMECLVDELIEFGGLEDGPPLGRDVLGQGQSLLGGAGGLGGGGADDRGPDLPDGDPG